MARGRMLSKSLSTSAKVAALYTQCPKLADWCRALFPLLLAHADDHGRLQGDELTVKLQVDPISPRKLPDFVAALHALHEVGLITWYQVGDRKVIEIVKFFDHQDLKGHDKRPAKLPACPGPDAMIGMDRRDGKTRIDTALGELSPKPPLREEKGREEKGREGNLSGGGFDRFWDMYPKKVGKDAARREWSHLAPDNDLTDRILASVHEQRASAQWLKDGGQFIPHPRTWLHQGRWQDEVEPASNVSGHTAMLVTATKGFLES